MKSSPKIETHPDAWQRFERAVDAGIKSGPKPKTAKKKKSGAAKNVAKRAARKPRD